MGGVDTFKDLGFLLKFIAMVVNIVALVLWVTGDNKSFASGIPARNFSQFVLFYHCVPAYMVVLVGIVILYLMDEPPGTWAQRIFGLVGAILFLVFGIIGLLNAMDDRGTRNEMLIAIMCLVVGILLAADFVKREFC